MAEVLVTDGQQRSALAAVRSLGEARHSVHVASLSGRSIAGRSRYARSDSRVPKPAATPREFAETIHDIVRKRDIDLLLPMTDASIEAILEEEGFGEQVIIPLPSREAYRAASDKVSLLDAARTVGIEAPRSIRVEEPADVSDIPLGRFSPPLVIKPGRSLAESTDRRIETGVRYASGRKELVRKLRNLPEPVFPLLVQEYVQGVGEGVFLLRWNGRTIASFAHRRIREKPPSGGVSVYRESVAPDPILLEASERLLDQFDWRGVAMVEYKRSDRDDIPYLMEVNGRFWGSLQLAVDAGVDFPNLLVSLALGNDPEPATSYRAGVRSRWWWGDVDHLIARLRGAVPVGRNDSEPDRLGALAEFLILWRPGDRSEVFRWSDPLPFLAESREWFAEALAGALGR